MLVFPTVDLRLAQSEVVFAATMQTKDKPPIILRLCGLPVVRTRCFHPNEPRKCT